MSGKSQLRAMIDSFFFLHPNRAYFVFVENEPKPGVDTFVVVTRDLNVLAFDRTAEETAVPAAALADWFSDTDEGQQTIEKFMAGLTEDKRAGSEVQARGELMLMPTNLTAH